MQGKTHSLDITTQNFTFEKEIPMQKVFFHLPWFIFRKLAVSDKLKIFQCFNFRERQ